MYMFLHNYFLIDFLLVIMSLNFILDFDKLFFSLKSSFKNRYIEEE